MTATVDAAAAAGPRGAHRAVDGPAAVLPAGDAFLPLLAGDRLDAPFAWRDGRPLSRCRFLADAAALAGRLPAAGPAVNLCVDRYRFAVALAAALLRGHTSLLPPDALPATLARIAPPGAAGYALADDAAGVPAAPGLRIVHVDARGDAEPAPHAAVPRIAVSLPAACLLTSGSTGTPQPHVKTWGALVANIGAEAARLAEATGRASLAGLTVVATVPGQHSYGFESSVLLALLGGAAFDAGRPFYPADVAEALARVPRPRALVTTPFHLKTLLDAGVALPPADLVVCATAPLSPQLARRAEHAFGDAPLLEIYGCTEAGQVATRRTAETDVWTTFGALRLIAQGAHDGAASGGAAAGRLAADAGAAGGGEDTDRTDARDGADGPGDAAGTDDAPGAAGAHGADTAAGSATDITATATAAAPAAPGRYLVHGGHVAEPTPLADVLELLDARRFRLLGRAGDVVNIAGKRSSLGHLNHHLNSIEGVEDGAFWMPADVADGVARPVAFVVAPRLDAARLRAALRERLAPAFVPRRIVFVDALPRAATGKLAADALAALAREHLPRGGVA